MQVPDEQALTVRLNSMGYQPVTIEMAPGARGGAAAAASARTLMAAPVPAHAAPQGSKLSADERSISRMYYQLHQGFKAGMPAFQTLTTVQAQIRHSALH